MRHALVVCLGLVAALPALADAPSDKVDLRFAWADGARWRVVDQWELEAAEADGDKVLRSGVTRALWTWEPTAEGKSLLVRQPVIVRSSPRDDATAKAIGLGLVEPWRATVAWEAAPAAPAPTPAEGAEGAEAAAVEAPPPAVPAPPTHLSGADPVAFVRGAPVERFQRVFRALDGRTFVPGRPVFDVPDLVTAGAEVSVRVDPLAYCPDVGPGSTCVQLTITRLLGGAPAEGGDLPAGAFREQETWVLEPATLTPHALRVDAFSGYDAGGATRQARASHVLQFLPPEPPPAVVAR